MSLKKSLVQANLNTPLINELVAITPIENHHFNLEAPQSCGEDGTMERTARRIKCQFHSAGSRKVTVSVCDNQKNYCKQEHLDVSVLPQTSKTPRIAQPAKKETVSMQKKTKKTLMQDFVSILPEQVAQAAKGKSGILVMVSTDWCPPCNVTKEFLLPSQEFKASTHDLLLVYVDGDSPEMALWKPYLHTYFYPSFVYLDKDLRRIDLITSYNYFTDFNKWLKTARQNHSNSIEDLESRILARKNKNLLQKAKDLLVSDEDIKKDQDRWIEYLENTAQMDVATQFVEDWKRFDHEFLLARLQYANLWYGKLSSQMGGEEKTKRMDRLAKKMLTQVRPRDLSEHWILSYLIGENCGGQNKDQEALIEKGQCKKLQKQLVHDEQAKKNEVWERLLPAEKLIAEARLYKTTAEVMRAQEMENVAQASFAKCGEKWQKTAALSPLQEKSRTSRMESIGCLKEVAGFNSLPVLQSLVADYPYDATFHGMLAQHHFEQKQFEQALAANNQALKYSYGDSWGKNLVKRVAILKAKGEKTLALKTINENLKEIVLEKDNKKQWWLNSLRAQQQELQQDVKAL